MSVLYRVRVETPEVRMEQIRAQIRASENGDTPKITIPFHHFKNRVFNLPLVRVSIDLPIYRMANYRTRLEQPKIIRQKGWPSDFFSNGQENQSAQQVQHEILYTFAQKGQGDSIVPIATVLDESSQEEPILITHTGVVVNGNRRLSTMRQLYINGASRYSQVDCIVLPDYATEEEIQDIEFILQMRPRTELPYDWGCESIAIKESLERGKTKESIAATMRKKISEIDNHLLAYEHAELYVTDRLNTPGDFTYADKQMFFDMAKNMKNKQGEDLEASRYIAFILTENSGNLGTRVYDYKNAFGPDSKEVIQRLARRLDITLTRAPETESQLQLDFNLDDYETDDAISFAPLIEVLKDKEKSEELAAEITDIYENIKNERSDRDAGQQALRLIRSANTNLSEVDLSRADGDTYAAIREQLLSIQGRVVSLMAQLERFSFDGE